VKKDRATKLLTYLAEVIVNGNPEVKDKPEAAANCGRRPFRRTISALRRKVRSSCWIGLGAGAGALDADRRTGCC
jgi:pyruvate carboxylase